MIRHIVFSILFCLFTLNGWAQQSNGLNSLAERLERFGREIPQEKVFVHMDNTCYFLGDTIWFSAYTRQTNTDEPSKVSNVLYAELLNEDGYLVERKLIELKEGHGNGYFALSRPLMYSGFYELRAYTRWQLNWGCFEHQHSHISKDWFLNNEMEHNFFRDYEKLYSRVFPIYDEPQVKGEFFQEMTVRPLRRYFRKNMDERELMLTLFPEGGNLVAGVENRVAFEAAWSDGEWAEGWLHFGNDSVAAMNRGRGMFTLIPEKGMEREVTFTAKDGQKVTAKLPKPEEQGVAVQVKQEGEDITIHANVVGLTPDSLAMTVMHEGRRESYSPLAKEQNIMIPASQFPSGIHQVTIFDDEGRVWADRLFFVMHPDSLRPSVRIEGAKDQYAPYEEISLGIRSRQIDSQGTLSIAVHDAAHSARNHDTGNIMTEMLLASEIKGFIPDPGWYFEKDDEEHRLGLDLLMMTQGWRRFAWREMSVHGEWNLKQPQEKSQVIMGTISNNTYWKGKGGRIIDPELAKDRVKVHAELNPPGFEKPCIGEVESTNGRFLMQLPPFYGDALFFLSASDTTRWKKNKGYEWIHLLQENDYPRIYHKRYPVDLSEFHVRIDFPYPRFVKPYNFYQTTLLDMDVDTTPQTDNDVLQLREVAVNASHGGMRKFDDSHPAFILDAYEAVNNAYDAGMKYTYFVGDERGNVLGREWIQFYEDCSIIRSYMSDYGLSYPYISNSKGQRKGNIRVRYGISYGRRNLEDLGPVPHDSIYHPKYLRSYPVKAKDDDESEGTDFDLTELDEYKNLSLLDKMVVYTDYSPRKEGTKRYRGSNLPETTLTLYPYPDGSRRPVYRDRRYILPGFAYPAEFYSPDYSKQTPPEPTDYRRTLYWNPNLKLDENGQARITFYNNSRTTQISVEAEGQASDGTLLWSK